jgi:hypothetical protein
MKVFDVLNKLGYEYYEWAQGDKTYEIGQMSDPITWSRRVAPNIVNIIIKDDITDKVKDCDDFIKAVFDRAIECHVIYVDKESFFRDFNDRTACLVDPWTGTHPRDAFAGYHMIDGMEKPYGEFWEYFLHFHKDTLFHYNGKTYTFKDFIDLNIEALRKEAKEYMACNIDLKNTMLEFMTTAESGQTYKGAITFTIERRERPLKFEPEDGIIEIGEKNGL